MTANTLYGMFLQTVQTFPQHRAAGFREGRNAPLHYLTYQQLLERVSHTRAAFDAAGLQKGDRFALLFHENRVEWAIADLACQSLGIITVPIYGTLPPQQIAYYLQNSGAKAVLVSNSKLRANIESIREELRSLQIALTLEPSCPSGFLCFSTLPVEGAREEQALNEISSAVLPDDIATLIYTSGTTGSPKGAMLTHSNMLQTPEGVVSDRIADIGPNDVFLSFLPLSHITERSGGYYTPLRVGACIVYSLGLLHLADELQTIVRPTALLCVPRLWESIHEKFLDSLSKMDEKQRKMVNWALNIGQEIASRKSSRTAVSPLLLAQQKLADKLVLHKIRTKICGGNLRFGVSGGAPLHPDTMRFFLGIGIELLEGYGMSECNIICINRPGRQRIGTVGFLMPETTIKIAADGEILMQGRGRTAGYYNAPQATAEAVDEDGWFHTGDIGELSTDGYLKITDRKKDLIVLSNGKKVAPQNMEAQLKQSAYISEIVLFGDRQPCVVAFIVPNAEKLQNWATENGIIYTEFSELLHAESVVKLYKSELEKLSNNFADFEKVRDFRLLPAAFTIESGELTPTLKVKRRYVAEKYAQQLSSMMR